MGWFQDRRARQALLNQRSGPCEVLLLFTEASRTDLNVLRSIENLAARL